MIMRFEDKLIKLRKDKRMSQENVAEIIGVSRQAVAKWESGQAYPDMNNLIAISDLYGVSVDNLVKEKHDIDGYNNEHNNSSQNNDDYRGRENFNYYRPTYEYKSTRKLFGMPLIHVNLGRGKRVAKGVIAVGNVAYGLVAMGGVSIGLISVGAACVGLVSLGAIAVGLGLAVGALSIGGIALGGIAVGLFAMGGIANGLISCGGLANGYHIAIGGMANGHIAIGDVTNGVVTISDEQAKLLTSEQFKQIVLKEFPKFWRPALDFMSIFFK